MIRTEGEPTHEQPTVVIDSAKGSERIWIGFEDLGRGAGGLGLILVGTADGIINQNILLDVPIILLGMAFTNGLLKIVTKSSRPSEAGQIGESLSDEVINTQPPP